MTRRLALLALGLAAAASVSGTPASAAPCDQTTIPRCIVDAPLVQRLAHLCFPPNVERPYSC